MQTPATPLTDPIPGLTAALAALTPAITLTHVSSSRASLRQTCALEVEAGIAVPGRADATTSPAPVIVRTLIRPAVAAWLTALGDAAGGWVLMAEMSARTRHTPDVAVAPLLPTIADALYAAGAAIEPGGVAALAVSTVDDALDVRFGVGGIDLGRRSAREILEPACATWIAGHAPVLTRFARLDLRFPIAQPSAHDLARAAYRRL